MQITYLITAIFGATAFALPTADAAAEPAADVVQLTERAIPVPTTGTLLFKQQNRLGEAFSNPSYGCKNLPSTWNDQTRSVSVAPRWMCTFYTNANCGGEKFSAGTLASRVGSVVNKDTLTATFDRKISSVECQQLYY